MNLRDRLEEEFDRYAALVLRRRALVIGLSLAIAAGLGSGLRELTIETSFNDYLAGDNTKQLVYDRFREEFGSDESVVLILRPSELYDLGFLGELRSLQEALETELPYVEEVTSLVNARRSYGTEDELISEGLMETWPEDEEDLATLRRRVEENPLYQNILVSADASTTTILIETDGSLSLADDSDTGGFEDDEGTDTGLEDGGKHGDLLTTEQIVELTDALGRVLSQHRVAEADIHVAGMPVFSRELGDMLTRDVAIFVSASLLLIGALLYVLFRTVAGVVYPLLVVSLSVISTLGWMGLVGLPLTAATEILPSLLLTIGIGDAVHVVAMFYKHGEGGYSAHASVRWAMRHSGLALLMTSLTTAASMASFNVAELKPLIDLGRAAPFGVGVALFFSVGLLPALMSFARAQPSRSSATDAWRQSLADRILSGFSRFGSSHGPMVAASTAGLVAIALLGASMLHFSQDDLQWLPADNGTRVATEILNEVMAGGEPFEVLIDTGKPDGLHDPAVLRAIEEMQAYAERAKVGEVSVGQGISVVDVLKEVHKALNGGSDEYYELPGTRDLVSQELLLFENAGTDDLEDVMDSRHQTARMVLTVPFVDALHYPRFAADLTREFDEILERRGLEQQLTVTITGAVTLAGETFDLLFVSMTRSYAVAFGLIAGLMMLLIGDLRLAVISIFPNVAPIVIILGLMGWLDAPLDVSSMLIGGILIGIAVDDTIHFVHNYNRYYRRFGCAQRAVRETLLTAGRAMLVTSIVLSLGFFVLMAASLENIADFGLLCGVGVILAFLADVLMMPALVAMARPCGPDCAGRARHHGADHL